MPKTLYQTNQFAAEFFQKCLYHSDEGKRALAYLLGRKFNRQMIKQFQIGCAPNAWDQLLQEAGKASIRPEILSKAGLAISKKEGGGYTLL